MMTRQRRARRAIARRLACVVLGLTLASVFACASTALASRASIAAIAPTPPMGWSSWYKFGCGINEALFERTARAFVSTGMAAVGYRYVNIDDCWMTKTRSTSGALRPNPVLFPDGISGVAAYVHARGLRLGIYLDTGSATCTGFPGSAGHFKQDVSALAAWKVDYIKADYCRSRPAPALPIYTKLQQAIAASGRQMLLSICEWGYEDPWQWGSGVGSTWRTTGDYFSYGAPRDYWKAILKILDLNAGLAPYAHPGAWNDPNAMLIGTGALTSTEERAQLSLWSMLAAPLIAGGDLSTASRTTISVLTNRDVIAVDQDRAGEQGTRVVRAANYQVWLRTLAGGSHALLLLNSGSRPATLTTDLPSLGLPLRSAYLVRDLWSHRSYQTQGRISARVQPHDVLMVKVNA
jgi:alpha-galactosidase